MKGTEKDPFSFVGSNQKIKQTFSTAISVLVLYVILDFGVSFNVEAVDP